MRSVFGSGGFLLLVLCVFAGSFTLCEMIDEYTADREATLKFSNYAVSPVRHSNPLRIQEDYLSNFSMAYLYYDSMQYDNSCHMFQKALSQKPADYMCLLGLAKSYIAIDSFVNAWHVLDFLIESRPNDYRAWLWRAELYNQYGHYDSTIMNLDSALNRGGAKDLRVWGKKSIAFLHLDSIDRAMELAETMIELDDSSATSWETYGRCLLEKEQYSSAAEAYCKAIMLEKKPIRKILWSKYYNRAFAYYELGDYNNAAADYEAIVALFPNSMHAWKYAGDCYYELDRPGDALRCYNRALHEGFKEDDVILNRRAWCHYNLDNYETAYDLYWEYLQIKPNDSDALYRFAWILCHLGNSQSALDYYDRCFAADTTNYDALFGKAYALGNLNRFNLAVDYYRRYLEFSPDDSNAWFNLALDLWDAQKKMSAIKAFDSCLKYDTAYGDAWYYKGQLLMELGKFADGQVCLDSAKHYGADMDE